MTRHDRGGLVLRPVSVATALAALVLTAISASAQAPAPRPAGDPARALDAARAAYEALPLDDRIDIQDGLVWSGNYFGALDGTFGRMTFEAIAAFQSRNRLPPDGILTPAARKALLDAARARKAALGFQPVDDKATGVRIHLPTKLLGPAQKGPKGTGWVGREGRIRVDTYATTETDLPGLFEQMKADVPGRKVVYAVLRPDWFVVSEEAGNLHRYARFARGPEGIRGFFFTLDASLAAELDHVVIATAGRFEPFPGATAAPSQTPTVAPTATPTGPAGPSMPSATKPAAPATMAASGLVVAPGKVVTAAAAVAGCRTVTVGGRPATVAVPDAEGVATLAISSEGGGPIRIAEPAAGAVTVLASGDGGGRGGIVAMPGDLADTRLRATLQRGGQGAPVFGATGALIGLVVGRPDETRAIAGLIPSGSYDLATTAVAAAVSAAGGTVERAGDGETLTTGRVVAAWAARVIAVGCQR